MVDNRDEEDEIQDKESKEEGKDISVPGQNKGTVFCIHFNLRIYLPKTDIS